MKISFIGGGNMGGAMISAILSKDLAKAADITVSDPLDERRNHLEKQYEVIVTSSNIEAVNGVNVIILAIKPQSLDDVMAEISGYLKAEQLVISIIAGKRIKTLRTGLKHEAIVRAMPNTPAQVGRGITVWTTTDAVTDEQMGQATAILGANGKQVSSINEDILDMATAVSGSGPAYVFLFAESLLKAAEELGMPAAMARELVLATLYGSAEYAIKSDRSLTELREMVTSPGGTTAAALEQLNEGGFTELIKQAVATAHKRAEELGG
jgi:pyrroline-5-carboxylate reductase